MQYRCDVLEYHSRQIFIEADSPEEAFQKIASFQFTANDFGELSYVGEADDFINVYDDSQQLVLQKKNPNS